MKTRIHGSSLAMILLGLAGCGGDTAPEPGDSSAVPDTGDRGDGATDSGGDGSDVGDDGSDVGDDGGASDAEADGDAMSAPDGDAGPSEPTATVSGECGLGPFARGDLSEEPCDPDPAPACPTAPAEGAVPVTIVATCAYGRDETECEPILGPACPDLDGDFFDFNLINPNEDAPIGCWARAHLLVEPNDAGGILIEYGGYALDNGNVCEDAGMVEGELDLENMCCERVIDLYFPHGEFTFRMAVRVDWTTP